MHRQHHTPPAYYNDSASDVIRHRNSLTTTVLPPHSNTRSDSVLQARGVYQTDGMRNCLSQMGESSVNLRSSPDHTVDDLDETMTGYANSRQEFVEGDFSEAAASPFRSFQKGRPGFDEIDGDIYLRSDEEQHRKTAEVGILGSEFLYCPRCNKKFTIDYHVQLIEHIENCTDPMLM